MDLFSEKANSISPYIPGEQPKNEKYIKLNTNENPYPPSKKAIDKIKTIDFNKLKLYPDPECMELRNTYSKILDVKPENIFVGNGSDEVLATAFQTFFMEKENVLMPDISYSFYPVYSDLYNVKVKKIPLRENFSINIKDYMIENNGIVIANPNAPTSLSVAKKEIELLLANNKNSVVLVDEAYVDFGAESVVNLMKKYKNLLVVKTLSKSYSLAGLRVGFAIGDEELINGMNKIKNSFNSYPIDMIAQIIAKEAITDVNYLNETINKVKKTRGWVTKELKSLGFNVLESKTNFLFIIHKDKSAKEIFEKLKENKILVRYFNKERIDNGLRVSIGTDEEMQIFIEKIKNIVKE